MTVEIVRAIFEPNRGSYGGPNPEKLQNPNLQVFLTEQAHSLYIWTISSKNRFSDLARP